MSAPHPGGGTLLVRDARTYPPGPKLDQGAPAVDVRVVDGRIAAVGAGLDADGAPVLEANGLTLIPGLVDVHVHFRDPGLARKEGWDTGSAGALHGGVTSVVEVQNNPPLSVTRARLDERVAHVRARSRVDFGCLATLTRDSIPELAAMAPATPAFKLFLGGSTGLGGELERDALRELFAGAKLGFALPVDAWLRGPLRAWAEELLSESRLEGDGLLRPGPIRAKWREHLSGQRNWQYLLWNVLMLQTWKGAAGL